MKKHNRIFVVLMSALMVMVFMPAMAFADDVSPWVWSEDKTSATYNGYEAEVTSEVTAPTCEDDGYTVFTAKYGSHVDTATVIAEDSALGHDWEMTDTVATVGMSETSIYAVFKCQRENCGITKNSSTVKVKNGDADEVDATCWEAGKRVYEAVVRFEGKNYPVTAKRDANSLKSHFDQGLIDHFNAVDADCENDGNLEYWFCNEDEKYFVENEDGEKVEISSDGLVVAKTGHDYGVKYTWAGDGSSCTAFALCKNCDKEVKVEGTITSEKTKDPTCTNKGETTYTATFDNDLFETQTKTIADIDTVADAHVWKISYGDGFDDEGIYKIGYAKCAECDKAIESEKVYAEAETVKGVTTLTFKFSAPFETQTDTMENHNQINVKAKTVAAKADKKTVIAKKKAFIVTNATGKVTFKKIEGNKKITVNKNGKIVVKKGLKKGKTYSVKVKVSAAGNNEVMAGTEIVTVKVKVK